MSFGNNAVVADPRPIAAPTQKNPSVARTGGNEMNL
jgi:hypothetical protein